MYYFAYGSNMNLEQMRRLCGWHFKVLGAVELPNYEFGPDSRGYANIREKQNSKIFGVLYELDQHALDILDEFEGFPQVFNRVEVEVADIVDGEVFTASVYIENPKNFGSGEIKEDYLKRLIAGARENRLPETWIEFLESFMQK